MRETISEFEAQRSKDAEEDEGTNG